METAAEWNLLTPSEKAKSLAEQAVQARKDGQDQAAAALYIQSLNLYRGLDDRPNILKTLIRLGYLSGWADFGDGLDMFARRRTLGEQALPLAREIGDKSLLSQALAAFAVGESREVSQSMLEESATLADECGDKSALAWAKTRLAGVCTLGGDRKRAAVLKRESLKLYEEIDDRDGIASVLFSMAIHAKRPQKRSLLERALVLRHELGEKKRIVEVLGLLQMYCAENEIDLKERYLLEELEFCRQIDTPEWLAGCLDRLAEVARKRGDLARAKALDAESRSVYMPPPPDPEFDEAFKQALTSGDMVKIEAAIKRMK